MAPADPWRVGLVGAALFVALRLGDLPAFFPDGERDLTPMPPVLGLLLIDGYLLWYGAAHADVGLLYWALSGLVVVASEMRGRVGLQASRPAK